MEELDCPAQNPDLSPTEHLWDELEQTKSQASHATSVCVSLCTFGRIVKNPHELTPKLCRHSLLRRVEAVLAENGPPLLD